MIARGLSNEHAQNITGMGSSESVLGSGSTHMRRCTSTCFSLRSYSARILVFSASSMRSFSIWNSSSVFSLISAAFSLASWWMNWTICGGTGRGKVPDTQHKFLARARYAWPTLQYRALSQCC